VLSTAVLSCCRFAAASPEASPDRDPEEAVHSSFIVVEGFVSTDLDSCNIRDDCWALALDQRAFGPRRLLVGFADRTGRLLTLAHAPRTDPAEMALGPCVDHLGDGAAAAIAWCDEPVQQGPPPPELAARLRLARSVCSARGVHLVDWIMCDDEAFRSMRLSLEPDTEWWDVP
jgi:hypothetical protein